MSFSDGLDLRHPRHADQRQDPDPIDNQLPVIDRIAGLVDDLKLDIRRRDLAQIARRGKELLCLLAGD